MEVKPGYKPTEVGVIPEEWEVRTIGEMFRLINGCAFKPDDWKPSGTPIIRIQNLNDPSAEFNYSQAPVPERNRIEAGDLLFAWSGTLGSSFGARVWNGPSGVLNQHIFKVLMDEQQITLPFSLLVFARVEEDIAKQAHGFKASFVHVKKSDLVKVDLPLPPLAEQRAIAAALSDVDGLLGGLDRLIAKKRDLKQAAMQQLLTGQTRLPGFHGEWEVKTLGDIVEKIVGGGTPSRTNTVFWGNEIPWVTVKDFATFNPQHSQESITRLGLRNSASNLIPSGTLITSTRMALGKAVVYAVDVAINQDLKALFLKPEASVAYLTYWFEHFGHLIDELGSGSTVKGISLVELRRFPFQAPPKAEQTAIAAVLSEMDGELGKLEQRREKTRALKQAMMQELLTGRTRLI
ncbi:MAG: restriction endonuclease subunit S [Verrucomicrobiaceae bacterium]|nr:restriction endonuclease subunit S [Verrucomicrobiaceae bacterium]